MQWKCMVILLGIFLLFGCATTGEVERPGNGNISHEIEEIKSMEINYVDPATVSDGEYTGEFPFGERFLYRVMVTVKSGRIADIEVLENGTGNEYAEKGLGVIERMLMEQSPDVDAVSGATVTSKALMKCVEKALKRPGG
ncbi:FMN-binding protein [Deltaproteobacteria bacterium]|nr:FMN-binding protein [Deltaproteobacteria bacterium]